MFDSSFFVNPTPLAHADTPRDILPKEGTSHPSRLEVSRSFVNPTPLAHADTSRDNHPRGDYHTTLLKTKTNKSSIV
ncbi:hypothetical protein TNCV_1585441 [Trichonephila clavipes]|nr:hypothetical protein TNCV_1585441 [Trichonephila clavipes]